MGKIELEALRKQARAYGLSPGAVARLLYHPSRQMGLRKPTEPRLRPSAGLDVSSAQSWRVAVCRPSQALGVADDLNELGFVAYCPLGQRIVARARVRGSDKRVRRIEQFAVFGPYLFVGEIDQPLVKDVHDGIIAIIGDSRGALSLNPAVVLEINQAELEGRWDSSRVRAWETPHLMKFKKGDLVEAIGGSLGGHQGFVEAIDKAGIKVGVEMFGRITPVTFEPKDLELA